MELQRIATNKQSTASERKPLPSNPIKTARSKQPSPSDASVTTLYSTVDGGNIANKNETFHFTIMHEQDTDSCLL